MIKLSKRLLTCARYTDGFMNLADIGTDHALLPIHCIKEGYVFKAQAIDNKEGPFVIAYANVKTNELLDKIKVVKADGLSAIEDDTDVVVISGMGGNLIREILLKNSLKNVKRFVLQPNGDANKIRNVLTEINYRIIDELVIEDGRKFYDIIVIEPGLSQLTAFEEDFGPINLKLKPYYFQERINKELSKLERVLQNMPEGHKIGVAARIQLLKEALK